MKREKTWSCKQVLMTYHGDDHGGLVKRAIIVLGSDPMLRAGITDEGRRMPASCQLGRAIAGLVKRALVVQEIKHREKEICAVVVSNGKTARREFGVCIRGRQVFCSCSDFRERGVYCKHIATVAMHELGALAQARSEQCKVVALVERRG